MTVKNYEKKDIVYRLQEIAIFLMVLLMCTSTYIKIGTIPVFTFFWGIAILLLIVKLFNELNCRPNYHFKKKDYISFFLLIWIVFAFVLLLTNNSSAGRKTFLMLLYNIGAVTILINFIDNKRKMRIICIAVLFGLFANYIVGMWEMITGDHIVPLSVDYERRFYNQPLAFYPNANDFSAFLYTSLMAIFLEYNFSKKKTYKLVLIGMMLMSSLFIYWTDSRGGMISTFVMVLILILYYFYYKKEKLNSNIAVKRVMVVFNLIIIIIISLIYISSIELNVIENGRMEIWTELFLLFRKNNFMALGPGQAVYKYGNAHNIFLEILIEYGIIIFIIFIILYLKNFAPAKNDKIMMILNAWGIAIIFISISSSSITRIYCLWCLVGLSLSYRYNIFRRERNKTKIYN